MQLRGLNIERSTILKHLQAFFFTVDSLFACNDASEFVKAKRMITIGMNSSDTGSLENRRR